MEAGIRVGSSKGRFIGALDQGTTSTRFVLFNEAGRVAGFDQMEHQQIYPYPGWVEHDPLEIFEKSLKVIVGAFSRSGIDPSLVMGMGITNQRETTIVWDRATGAPVYNAIVWQDLRTADACQIMEAAHGPLIKAKTGLPVTTYFSASKIRWILDNVPQGQARAEAGELCFGTLDTWLLYRLTGGPRGGVHYTEPSNASRTLLMNLETLDWDQELLALWNIPRSMMPTIKSSSEVYGTTVELAHNLPIASLVGDQQAALFGQGCHYPGEAKNTYGTGCFLLMNTGDKPMVSQHGLLTTVGCILPGHPRVYCLEGAVAMAGGTVQWLRDNLGIVSTSTETEALAASIPDNGGVYLVPAFSGLFAPYWRPDARGAILGLTRFATKAHIARAALEATAYQTMDVLDAMAKDAGLSLPSLKVDGGMTVNGFLMQFQADILGIPVVRPQVIETTALGAAWAAGLALGMWPDLETLRAQCSTGQHWEPKLSQASRTSLVAGWQKALDKSLDWVS